jgi:hypothetical protein
VCGCSLQVSSKSIVKAILGGDASTYNRYVDEMVKSFPEHDNGVAHIYKGAFFLAGTRLLSESA